MTEETHDYSDMSVYELCALYCDYSEWLDSPTTAPQGERTIAKYRGQLRSILRELAYRYETEEE